LATASAGALPVHRLHDEEIERLLATGERRHELLALFGEQGYRELSTLARRAATTAATRAPRARVYVLPGLMGSRLGSRGVLLDDVLWVDLVEIAAGHLTRLALPVGASLVALGALLLNSLKLKLSLRIAGFDARMHAYDWRRSVGELATELNTRIAREALSGEVHLVGHSLGGVVARVALGRQVRPRITRVVQLGSPNHGSYAPVLALRAVYPTVRKLAALDRRHSAEDLARIVFRTLPSLHELLPDPLLSPGPDLFDPREWPSDALRPDATLLAQARQQRATWPGPDERCLHVAGVRQDTVVGVRLHGAEFEYSVASRGDATVPLDLAVRPGERAWFIGEKHGGLPNNGRAIAAVVDLLRTGETERLPRSPARAGARSGRTLSEAALRRVAPHKVRWQHLSPDARRRLLEPVVSPEFHGVVTPATLERAFDPPAVVPGSTAATVRRRAIELRLVHGSIVDANARAVVLGVFRSVDPSGPAAAVDAALGGAIREFTLRRMFAGQLGQVFVLPATRGALLAELVLFAGLGPFDDFGTDAAVFAAENIVRTFARTHVEDFATVLFGAGSGVPVALAVEQQLRGYVAGLRHADPEGIVRRITFCELDARKYRAMARALRRLAAELSNGELQVTVDEAPAPVATPRSRPARGARTVRSRSHDPVYLLAAFEGDARKEVLCRTSLLTAGAKAAVLSGSVRVGHAELARQLAPLEQGRASARDLARIGAGLAALLLAPAIREGLSAMHSRPLVVVHERGASRVPWEVVRIGDAHPALGAGLSRRYQSEALTVARWRDDRRADGPLRVLLVVDPTRDLPGAAAEGSALQALFHAQAATVSVLQGRDATRARILAALGTVGYDVLHFAGHASFDARRPGAGGLVCAGREVLTGSDLESIAALPALVFCNACEAARVRRGGAGDRARRSRNQRSFAGGGTGIGEAFLSGGVANFLGTHWPVGDQAAREFSQVLYGALLAGESLGDAVLRARRATAALPSLDWADYVHYGNAEFRLVPREASSPPREP
jgi:hypothetical protein